MVVELGVKNWEGEKDVKGIKTCSGHVLIPTMNVFIMYHRHVLIISFLNSKSYSIRIMKLLSFKVTIQKFWIIYSTNWFSSYHLFVSSKAFRLRSLCLVFGFVFLELLLVTAVHQYNSETCWYGNFTLSCLRNVLW